jgi:nicotinate-nucleotide--dimethylbenzimidazole phosphoribosyltransferase
MEFNISSVKNEKLAAEIQQKIDTRTKPPGSLGMLEEIVMKISMIQQTETPDITNPTLIVFAADHGLADEGVSAFPKEVTPQMVFNFLNGGAAVNVFAEQNGFDLQVVDAGVDFEFENCPALIDKKIAKGTANILQGPAMTPEQCEKALQAGAELVVEAHLKGTNLIAFGEMGIGNTSSAALIMSRILNLPVSECTGRGTGLDDEKLKNKIKILEKALDKHPDAVNAMDVLQCLGGFEIAMTAGAVLKAAELKMTVLVDGFIITSAVLVAAKLYPQLKDYLIFAHLSDEYAHGKMIQSLDGKPLLRLNMRLGEGSGAAVALPIVRSGVNFLNKMASFEEAAVSEKD